MKSLLLAIQFLTIIPVRVTGPVTEKDIGKSAIFFSVAGMLQGLIAGGSAFLLSPLFPAEIIPGMVILLLTLSNGGFHLDGLADTFDAIAARSSGNADQDCLRRLSVMKDSATGALGVASIVLSVLLKYIFISALFAHYSALSAVYMLLAMPIFSKWAMTVILFHGRSARKEGLGRIFIDQATIWTVIFSTMLLIILCAAIALFLPLPTIHYAINFLLPMLICLYTFSLLWVAFCEWRFRGSTGDTVGAGAEIAELLFLAIAVAWLK